MDDDIVFITEDGEVEFAPDEDEGDRDDWEPPGLASYHPDYVVWLN